MPRITLPYPPSVNHYWRRVGPRTLISRQGRQYAIDVAAECLQAGWRPVDGGVSVTIHVFAPDNLRRDIENVQKALLDALQGYAYHDDFQIDRLLTIRREVIGKPGKVVVIVEPYDRTRFNEDQFA